MVKSKENAIDKAHRTNEADEKCMHNRGRETWMEVATGDTQAKILKSITKRQGDKEWPSFSERIEVADSCYQSNENLGSIKNGNFFVHLSDCQLFKKDSVPWNRLLKFVFIIIPKPLILDPTFFSLLVLWIWARGMWSRFRAEVQHFLEPIFCRQLICHTNAWGIQI